MFVMSGTNASWRWGSIVVRMQSGGRRTLATLFTWLVLALGAFTFAVGLTARSNVGERWDLAVEKFGGPNLAVRATSADALDGIGALPGVTPVGARSRRLQHSCIFAAPVQRQGPPETQPWCNSLNAVPVTLRIVRPVPLIRGSVLGGPLVAGRWLSPSTADTGVVVDASLARDLGLRLGGTITIARGAARTDVRIVGTAIDTANCLLPDCKPGTLWADDAIRTFLGEPSWPEFEQSFRVRDEAGLRRVVARSYGQYRATIREVKTGREIRNFVTLGNGLLGNIVAGFGLLALIASAILISSTTSTRLASMRRDFGLLQLIGASSWGIAKVVLFQSVVMGLTASSVGWGVSHLLRHRLVFGPAKSLPAVGARTFESYTYVLAAVLTIVLISTILPALRSSRVEVLSALRPRSIHRRRHAIGFVPSGVSTLVGQTLLTQIRHFAIAFIALVLTGSAAVTAAGYDAAISAFAQGSTSVGAETDYRLVTDKPEQMASLDRALRTDPDIAAWWKQTTRNVLVDGRTSQARFVDGNLEDLRLAVRAGRLPQRRGEVVLGYALLKGLGRKIGDRVTITVENRSFPATVVGQVIDGGNAGRLATLLIDDLPEKTRWDMVRAMRFREGSSVAGVRTRMLRATLGPQTPEVQVGSNTDRARPYRVGLWVIALAIMAVGIAQLTASLLLATRARARDLATLRTVGTDDRDIIRAHIITGVAIAVVSSVVALPLGIRFTRWSIDEIASGVGVGPGLALPSPYLAHALLTFLLAAVCACAAAVVVRVHLAGPIADALRTNE